MNNQLFQEKFVRTSSGQIFYYLENSFPGRPFIILLHGLSSNHTTWLNAMETLRANGYNCLAPDLRGHGHSDKTKNKKLYPLPVFSDDLRQIIDKEQINNFILVGYSFGGQIAIDTAAKHPEGLKGLILISTNHAPPLGYLHLGFLTPAVSGGLKFLAALLFWQKLNKYHYYEHGRAVGYWDSVWDGLRTMPMTINFWLLAQEANINLKNELRQIKIPTIFVCGRNDAFITKKEIDEMTQAVPNSQLIISKNPSHFVATNSQEEITQIILDFLRKYENSNI